MAKVGKPAKLIQELKFMAGAKPYFVTRCTTQEKWNAFVSFVEVALTDRASALPSLKRRTEEILNLYDIHSSAADVIQVVNGVTRRGMFVKTLGKKFNEFYDEYEEFIVGRVNLPQPVINPAGFSGTYGSRKDFSEEQMIL